jgi:hypothetical protein
MENNFREYKEKNEKGEWQYYLDGKFIGTEYVAVQYLINSKRMSSSKAHKYTKKIKENKKGNSS